MRANTAYLWRFVLVAFLASVLLPFFAVYTTSPLSAASGSLFGDRVLICSADGFKWIKRSDVGKQQPHKPTSHYQCALCYVASHGLNHLIVPAGIALACVFFIIAAQRIRSRFAARLTYRPRFTYSRGPPAFSF